jgi:uncharacterized protein (TIGR02246 family)
MRRRMLIVLAVSAAIATGAAQAFVVSEEMQQELVDALAVWTEAFNKHDAEALAREYAEDANVLFVTGELLEGRQAVKEAFAEYFAANKSLQTKISDVKHTFLTPEIVIEDGAWKDTGLSGDDATSGGYYTSVLVKSDGKWLVKHERAWESDD